MKYTLLEITQSILSSMDSDEVTSINDTVESQQVVEVIKTVYDDIISRGDLQSNKVMFNMTSLSDPTMPVLMSKPTTIDRIDWLKYNSIGDGDTDPEWIDLYYLPVEEFIHRMHSLNPTETNVDTFDYTVNGFTVTIVYKNDVSPNYFTSFDDTTIVMNAIDTAVDTFLPSNKTLGYGFKISDFTKDDAFVPNLQPQQFALLLNEAKSLAWAELKQVQHAKAEQAARRNWIHLQKTRQQVPDSKVFNDNSGSFNKLPNFGRP